MAMPTALSVSGLGKSGMVPNVRTCTAGARPLITAIVDWIWFMVALGVIWLMVRRGPSVTARDGGSST